MSENSVNNCFAVVVVKVALHGTATSGVASTYSLLEILTFYLYNYNHDYKLGFKFTSAYSLPEGKHLAFVSNF